MLKKRSWWINSKNRWSCVFVDKTKVGHSNNKKKTHENNRFSIWLMILRVWCDRWIFLCTILMIYFGLENIQHKIYYVKVSKRKYLENQKNFVFYTVNVVIFDKKEINKIKHCYIWRWHTIWLFYLKKKKKKIKNIVYIQWDKNRHSKIHNL